MKALAPLIGLMVSCAALAASEAPATVEATERQRQRWNFFLTENEIDRLWLELSARAEPAPFAVTGVSLIPMRDARVLPDHTVVVRDGRIVAVGPTVATPVPAGAEVVDGRGKFMTPGLVDMHVHNLVTNANHMVHLARGVTSVRDMAGFAWLLRQRDRIADNRLLAPNLYVAGHILSAFPMEFYATVVGSPEAARLAVRDQVAQGYDFIKVHNGMPLETYRAVHDEARERGVDVVGHIPNGVSIAEALAQGQRTVEHFKGYIVDSTLQLTGEDYAALTDGAEVWHCPTFHTYRNQLRGTEALQLLREAEEMRYVPPSDRKDWAALAETPVDRLVELRRGVLGHSRTIFENLLQVDARFVAGTDAGGGLPYMVPGFALHDELRMMEEVGLSPYETLRAATVNAAQAMRREEEFGTIEVGKRADLLLVAGNPLETTAHLAGVEGVAVRGIWLSRERLEAMLSAIAGIYEVEDPAALTAAPSVDDVRALIGRMKGMRAEGFAFRDYDLEELARLLLDAGLDEGDRVLRTLVAR